MLNSVFDLLLPVTEDKVLDLTKDDNKLEIVALDANYKVMNDLVLAFETAKLTNKVMEEQAEDDNCPGGKFTKTWAQIQDNEKPNDTMVKMELDEDLRGIGLSKRKYLKLLLAKMSALKIKYGIPIADTKNCAVILRDGQKDYVEVMTITSTVIIATTNRKATPQEMVDVMHKQWRI